MTSPVEAEHRTDDTPDRSADGLGRRLAATAVAMLVLIVLPIGIWWSTTRSQARFADTEVFDANRLGAATLDIEFGPSDVSFQARNMAPGDRVSGHLELTNTGSLPLVFGISARSTGSGALADWLLFHLWTTSGMCRPLPEGTVPTISNHSLGNRAVTLLEDGRVARTAGIDPRLDADETVTVCLGADLPLEAPNLVQGREVDVQLIVDAVHDVDRSDELRSSQTAEDG